MQEEHGQKMSRMNIALVALAGLSLIGIVVFASKYFSPQISIVASTPAAQESKMASNSAYIVAEISGEVQNPGVYKMDSGARIDDLIKLAGELTDKADTDYVSRSINRAEKIKDGQKIFVPNKQSKVLSANIAQEGVAQNKSVNVDTASISLTININQAEKSELEKLWGIGPVTAQKIIDQRPYSEISELVTKKILKSNVYEKIKDQISVY